MLGFCAQLRNGVFDQRTSTSEMWQRMEHWVTAPTHGVVLKRPAANNAGIGTAFPCQTIVEPALWSESPSEMKER